MAVLATIGATSPFVGLFGTVWGIMNSFIGISKSQTTNLAVVAPGIAEALLATAIGLVAAIPAVIIYNHSRGLPKAILNWSTARQAPQGGYCRAISTVPMSAAGSAPVEQRSRRWARRSQTPTSMTTAIPESHEINVTPFIDVILVLLIIFMVAAPLSTVDLPIDLPTSTANRRRSGQADLCQHHPDLSVAIGETWSSASIWCVRWMRCQTATRTVIYFIVPIARYLTAIDGLLRYCAPAALENQTGGTGRCSDAERRK